MFKLNIECSKDIDFLKINFSDGTSVIKESKRNNSQSSIPSSGTRNEKLLDTNLDQNSQQDQTIVELPVIKELNREIKVAAELQNLDI